MARILVGELDDEVVERLKARASEEGRSLRSVVKRILAQAAFEPKVDMEHARKISERLCRTFRGRKFPDSEKTVREGAFSKRREIRICFTFVRRRRYNPVSRSHPNSH